MTTCPLSNRFRSEEEKQSILQLGLEQLKKEAVLPSALRLGKKYRKKIESDFSPLVSIRLIGEEIGHGVFAEEVLKKGSFVGEYRGVIRKNDQIYSAAFNHYCYKYPLVDERGRHFVIDASEGNFTRFINHSYKPNLRPHYAFVEGIYYMVLTCTREIQKGEQLCYDYGRSYWYIRSAPAEL